MRLKNHFHQIWQKGKTEVADYRHTYFVFAVLRIVLVFIPQIGYIHPDEFFQSVEVITGDHFHLEHVRTWEFNNTLPLRSITLPFLLLRLPWCFFEFFAIYAKSYTNYNLLNSYVYLVFPRFIFCALSFINDWSMYRLCRLYNLRYEMRMLALASSWVMLVFGTRTFSNTIEMSLCSLLIYLVSESMIKTNTIVYKKEYLDEKYNKAESIGERVKLWKLKNALPAHNFNRLLIMSTLCVIGVFNRATFLAFGAPMVFFWMLRGMGSKTITFKHFNLRMLLFCLCALPSLLLFTFCDSLYYKYLTAGELQMLKMDLNNFVFVPWNFVKYNLDASNTAGHGVHPKYLHTLVNLPLLFNVLAIIALFSFASLLRRFYYAEYRNLPRAQSLLALMSSCIFVPLGCLSLINHQEARFLIPLLFPIVQMHAPKLMHGFCPVYPFDREHVVLRWLYKNVLSTKASAKSLLKIWYITNILLTVFFGFIHQAGVFPLAQHFEGVMLEKPVQQHVHLVTSHIYSLPLSFVNVASSKMFHYDRQSGQRYRRNKEFFVYEYGGMEVKHLLHKIKLIQSNCEVKLSTKQQSYRLFLALPTSLSDELSHTLVATNASNFLHYKLERIFYPHLSTEALPQFFGRHLCALDLSEYSIHVCDLMTENYLSAGYILQRFSSVMHQFGLALYEFETNKQITKDM